MQKTLKAAVIALALTGGVLASVGTANAEVSISFNTGIVAYGYNDGYWDHNRQWHAWQHPSHRDTFRNAYATRYYDGQHTRYRDYGWRGPAQPVVTFNVANVLFGYDDGYWDRNRQWHVWQHPSHLTMYRNTAGNQYYTGQHTRYRDYGWRGPVQPIVTFNVGNVLFGYDDGYWDRNRQWHVWQHPSHLTMYRNTNGNQYFAGRHDRHPNNGWRGQNDNRNDRHERNDRNDRNDRHDRNDRNDRSDRR
ncbi:MAG: hypothetical protein AB7P50_13615 [Alphaproteobacteria bacterium]